MLEVTDSFQVNFSDGLYCYGIIYLNQYKIEKELRPIGYKRIVKSRRIKIDSLFVHYLSRELFISAVYRKHFISKWSNDLNRCLKVLLQPTKYDTIDYNWNDRICLLVRERCELDHALSWLSTLGGAFSALGDYIADCAEVAGKISLRQFQFAIKLGDPNIAARCRLYLSISLIQKKQFRLAQKIILQEYHTAKSAVVVDRRLMNMCRGIWCKLQYEHRINRRKNQIEYIRGQT